MQSQIVETLAGDVIARLKAAQQELLDAMASRGLLPSDGWRIREELKHTVEGTEWIFRPVHLREETPELFVKVRIDHDGRLV